MGEFADLVEILAPERDRWFDDPVSWAREVIRWPEGQELAPYQAEALAGLVANHRESVRSLHGAGKTTTAALTVLWFADTRDRAGLDWKAITTASAWRQVTKYLWPEIHKWAKRIDWTLLGRKPWNRDELRVLSLKLANGEAFGAVSDDHEKIEGAHADQLLFVFDEAKAIPPKTWDAVEGAFSGGGADTGAEAFVLSISTPGEPQGRFFDIQSKKRGYEDWHARRWKIEAVIKAGRVSPEWVDQRRKQWGEGSALFQNRVLGEFATSEEDGVIPLAWVEAAQSRWEDFHKDCPVQSVSGLVENDHARKHKCDPGVFLCLGVDPARYGPDKTVLALRHEDQVLEVRKYSKLGTTETTGRVAGILDANGGRAVVDVIGIGAGVVDQLREQKVPVVAFNAAEGTSFKDSSGELSFLNARAAAWWHMRERLDPNADEPIMLPPDDELTGDLTAPKWKVASSGKIQIESKDDIRKRLGRSTDVADAVVQAFWVDLLGKRITIASPVTMQSDNYWREAG